MFFFRLMNSYYTKKSDNLFLVLLLCVFAILGQEVKATHLMGGDLSYTWMGGDTYKLRLSMYRDCAGIAINTSYSIDVSSSSCGYSTSLVANLEPGYPVEVSAVCISQIGNTTCHPGGTLQGVEEYVYSVIYTLPAKCNDWRFGMTDCCRNNSISTGQAGNDFYIEAMLNNLDFAGNNSPDFVTKPVPFLIANQLQNFSHVTIEQDGDLLVYSLVAPLQDPITPVTYLNPYNANYPVSTTSGTFPINSANGQLSFTPNLVQNGVLAVLVQEYRNGILIGSVRRDIQMVVVNSPSAQVSFGPITNLSGATMNAGQTNVMTGCVGVPITFTITATDQGGNTPTITHNANTAIAGSSMAITGAATRTMTLSWTPPANSIGYNAFYITANNNQCPIPSLADVNIVIYVAGVDAFAPDPAVCIGQSTQLNCTIYGASGGTYAWSGTGLSAYNIANPIATPTSLPATYHVTYTQGLCSSFDDVTITSDGSINATPSRRDVCPGTSVSFNANASLPGSATSCGLSTAGTCMGASANYTVGAGASTIGYPFSGVWHDGRTQMLFTASELAAAGIGSGLLTAAAFNIVTKQSSAPYNNMSIKIGCTNLSAISSFVSGLSTVYSGNYSSTAGWNTINFNTNYAWDGTTNLIVELCYDNSSYTNSDVVAASATAFSSVFYNYDDFSVGCSFNIGVSSSTRPNIRFTRCAAGVPSYLWTPSTGLSSTTIANPTLTVSGSNNYVVEATLNGCTVRDTVVINTNNLASAVPSQTSICDNATVPVQITASTLLTPSNLIPTCGTNSYTCSSAATPITIGALGNVSYNYPFGNYYEDGRMQMLFLASELVAAGLSPGNLSSISLNISDHFSDGNFPNFNVSMACTNLTSLSSFQSGLTTLFSGTVTVTGTGWITINFSSPYGWNGTSNLIVQMCFDKNTWSDDDYAITSTTGFNSVIVAQDDGVAGCSMTSPFAVINERPVTRFMNCTISNPITYAWSPPTGLSSTSISNPTALPSSTTNYTVTVNNGTCAVTATAQIAVSVCAPLPIENLSLTATLRQEDMNFVQLDWTTDKEINVQSFTVERKRQNESDFSALGNTNAKGSPSSKSQYQFFDMDLKDVYVNEKILYRLRENDGNGNERYSDIVEVFITPNTDELFVSLFPNPAQNELTIQVQNNNINTKEVKLTITDYTGKVINVLPIHYFDRNISIDVSTLTAGAYFVAVTSVEGKKKYLKFIKS